ncbi:Na+/H+ antiporter NhaC [Natranaerobius trueperi]|uniref:Na+/H+ antiporter NhaC n=1 Tax=Natranaerobius trueperi TaxID=759412 RepID=A0A226BY71_9FIRM|nr:Na+/H+ antiporter NhaC [Natranaerobius trueperi]OWZ83149.1 Na+/H+ antiporter NhaC [Natranaerobius trueperi]
MTKDSISVVKASILLIASISIVLGGVIFAEAPTEPVLILAGMVTIGLALMWGIDWDTIQDDLINNLQRMFIPILILMSVGMVIGVWILSGTVPLMIYYGLQILNPTIFLVAAAILCAIMSILIGTSWGTLGTAGVALMGISVGLGIPPHYTAGAVVVGAIFGDKMSPLSDTTVLAAGVTGTDIVDHIKHMLYTTIPGFVISLIVYAIIGFKYGGGEVSGEDYDIILNSLQNEFNLNPLLILPPILVLFLIYRRKSPLMVFGIGILLGSSFAVIFQGATFLEVTEAMSGGYTRASGAEVVDEMLHQGGLMGMMGTVALLISAAIFGSPLKSSGVIDTFLNRVQNVAKSAKSIMFSNYILHGLLFTITGSYYVTYAVFGPMVSPLFDEYKLHCKNLSRLLEDSGTNFAPVVPWSVTGAFVTGTLGVEYTDYILFAPMTYLALVFGLIYVFTGFSIEKTE